jgi:hypothetical protein
MDSSHIRLGGLISGAVPFSIHSQRKLLTGIDEFHVTVLMIPWMRVSAVEGYVTHRFLYQWELGCPSNRLLAVWCPIYKRGEPGNAGRIVYGFCKMKINAISIVTGMRGVVTEL